MRANSALIDLSTGHGGKRDRSSDPFMTARPPSTGKTPNTQV